MSKSLIYLDNCCFNRPYDDQSSTLVHIETQSKLDIQLFIRQGKIDLAWSFILDYENSQNPFVIRKIEILMWRSLAQIYQDAHETIKKKAEELLSEYRMSSKDALHVSCAIHMNCRWFVTTDKEVLKKCNNLSISILNPIDFIRIYGEEYYDKS